MKGSGNNSALSLQSLGPDAIEPDGRVGRVDKSAIISPAVRDWIKKVIVPILVKEYLEKRK